MRILDFALVQLPLERLDISLAGLVLGDPPAQLDLVSAPLELDVFDDLPDVVVGTPRRFEGLLQNLFCFVEFFLFPVNLGELEVAPLVGRILADGPLQIALDGIARPGNRVRNVLIRRWSIVVVGRFLHFSASFLPPRNRRGPSRAMLQVR